MSYAQHERQRSRNTRGRYNTMNPCEVCGRGTGVSYGSHPECNTYGFGLVLCDRRACWEVAEQTIAERKLAVDKKQHA